jgi:hypothetical protein
MNIAMSVMITLKVIFAENYYAFLVGRYFAVVEPVLFLVH